LGKITDFVLSADMKLLSGVSNYGFEILWDNYNNSVYIGIININDLQEIWIIDNDNTVIQKDISSYLKEKDFNNLKWVQEGLNTKVYINDEEIDSVKLSQLIAEEALLTLKVNTESAEALPIVRFDNFRLLELK
jgi:hypothetical protein